MDAVDMHSSDPPENVEGIVSTVDICRICLMGNVVMRDLFLEDEIASLSTKAMSFANVKISPDDGLPRRVCCGCAEKLESAYDFKLQVEQADSVLRQKFDNINIKAELFFNEVEVHLDSERHQGENEIHMTSRYSSNSENINEEAGRVKDSLLKDHLALLQVEQLTRQQRVLNEVEVGDHLNNGDNESEVRFETMVENENQRVENGKQSLMKDHLVLVQINQFAQKERDLSEVNRHLKRSRDDRRIHYDSNSERQSENSETGKNLLKDHLVLLQIEGLEHQAQFSKDTTVHIEHDNTGEKSTRNEEDFNANRENHNDSVNNPMLLKDHLALLEIQQLTEQEHVPKEGEEATHCMENERLEEKDTFDSTEIDETMNEEMMETSVHSDCVKTEALHMAEAIRVEEHDYMLPHGYMEARQQQEEQQRQQQQQYSTETLENPAEQNSNESSMEFLADDDGCNDNSSVNLDDPDGKSLGKNLVDEEEEVEAAEEEEEENRAEIGEEENDSSRKSKRKSNEGSQSSERRESDEENYFENLNLSSRLKKVQDKAEKVFMCFICEKQFLSKSVLKEHMHSHEEVRRALSLKKSGKSPTKAAVTPTPMVSTPKATSSGKQANKCPYCGKEYLYVISFNKHLRQHEKEGIDSKSNESSVLDVSAQQDDVLIDFTGPGQSSDSEADKNDEETNEEGQPTKQRKLRRKKRTNCMYSCDKCNEKFPTRRNLQKHSVKHALLKCNVCTEEYDSQEKLKDHRTKHVMEGVLTEQDLLNDSYENLTDNDESKNEKDNDDDFHLESENSRSGNEVNAKKSRTKKESRCPYCSKTYNDSGTLQRHIGTHTGTKFSCKVCCQQFATRESLRRHMDEYNDENESFKCNQCNKVFGNEFTLRNHLIATNHKTSIHGQEYDPNKRMKRVAAKAAQKIIDKIKTEDGFDDDDMNNDEVHNPDIYVAGNKQSEVVTSKKSSGKSNLVCATCNRKCISKLSLTKHMEHHVKNEKNDKDKHKTPAEKKEAQRQQQQQQQTTGSQENKDDDRDFSDFESGLDWPMETYECTTCKKRYSTKKSLIRHQLLHEEPNFECDICNVKFYRKDKLKAHYDKCSEKNPDQVRKCNICGDIFENNEILREHRSKHVTEGILTEEDLRDIELQPEEKSHEKVARKRRTDIVGLECTECNKQYTSRKGLLRHIQVHEGKKYLCDICPKKFYRREHLKIHMAKHNMIKPYKCTRCTKRFIKEEQLTNHLSKHDRTFKKNKETDSSKRFLCEICSKSFTQSTTLIAHLRAHNGIKPYVCEVCSRPFTTNAYLKMHMRTHTQERPYICQYCSRAFARADTLANHLTSHTGEAKYHCKYCPKNFRRLKSLKEHVFIHTGQRPYACPTCDRRFNNNGSRYAHSKRCKQNMLQNQNRPIQTRNQPDQQQQQEQQQQQHHQQQQQQQQQQHHHHQHHHLQHQIIHETHINEAQIIKTEDIETITITRPVETIAGQQVMQHQEILMPLILPLTVTLADVGEEVILPEGTKIFTTS